MAKPTPTATRPQKVTTFLMFSTGTAEAVKHYVSVFKDAKVLSLGDMGPGPDGTRMVNATFELEGQRFMAMDGGPHFAFAEGMSLFVDCATQDEVDHFWDKLSQGGKKGRCGWLTDKWGVSWQVVPSTLGQMLGDSKNGNSAAVMQAMLKMGKLDVKALQKAYAQPWARTPA
ncbi:MAG: hypothetical protein QOI63_591 [Thermoplasmata archaeon]|jgi:predicted 3-demethylubiquinone-9 3-methyltransferase (glyoxalase superfamily)|nr:hypothetical protein [Thermoplasmata archaeon]